MPYIHFTDDQKRRASEVDLEQFLLHRGEKLIPSGHEKRLSSDHSITVRGNRWYDHAEEKGGGPISFLQKFYGRTYPEAVTQLLSGEQGMPYEPVRKQQQEGKKSFSLPPASPTMRRVYAYLLQHRGISREVLKELEAMAEKYRFALPPFCHFTPEDWQAKGHDYDEIRDNMLGWDITDYGLGDFNKVGFSLITIRNGNLHMRDKYAKSYAEKLLYLKEGQYSPMHFHWSKMEDIINRGGGNVLIRVYNSTPDEDLDRETDVHVHMDGREIVVPAGTQVRLTPGESISIQPYMYHDFEIEKGTGSVLLGEVSQCNDDNADNRFHEKIGRFPAIEEDEPPYRLLCNEYPEAK